MAEIHDLLKARFAYVRQDFDGVFARLGDAELGWAPAPGMPTIGDLLLEIANKEKETIAWIQTGTWPDGEPDAFDLQRASLADMRSTFDRLRRQTYAYIDSLSEAELDVPVQSPDKWWEALRLTSCPRHEVIRNIANHEWYHTAQLITYLWTRGDNPNNW